MLRVTVGSYTLSVATSPEEVAYAVLPSNAFRSRLESEGDSREYLTVVVSQIDSEEALVVQGWYSPGPRSAFHPGVLVIPETCVVFVGAGTTVRSYSLTRPALIEDGETDVGFWGWKQHGDLVVMSAELELSVWTVEGIKLWSRFVEPPWDYKLEGAMIEVDVMGQRVKLTARTGMPG